MQCFTVAQRALALALLVAAFVGQSLLIYSDPVARQQKILSPEAQQGKLFYQERNCQACHQLYGFGGFLGSDLTNMASRHSLESMSAILAFGPKQMPRFDFSSDQARALYKYFEELNATGRSTRSSRPIGARHSLNKLSLLEGIPWFAYD